MDVNLCIPYLYATLIMNVSSLSTGYDLSPADIQSEEARILTYHRIAEAFRFAYAKRSSLGDERNNPNITEVTILLIEQLLQFSFTH